MVEASADGRASGPRGRPRGTALLSATTLAAVGVATVAMIVYLRTMLRGSSFGDWGEMQLILGQLGVPHPTGYPLYMALGKAFDLLPIGTPAYRATLLSAVAAAGAVGVVVLIAARLGVRASIAAIAGLTLAVSGTLWLEATFPEMNGLHLLLVALLIHRALVWRAERRDRDLRIGALLAGLSLANHLLAITVVPIVLAFVLVLAWRRLRERPVLVVQSALLFLIGPALYSLIPIRALFGPPEVYAGLLTWDGVSSLISGAQFRSDMHFGSVESLVVAVRAIPGVAAQVVERSDLVVLAGGLAGAVVLLVRDRWAGLLFALIAAVNVYFYAGYLGDLDHYLLVGWLVLSVWLAVAAEALVTRIGERPLVRAVALGLLCLVPLSIAVGGWTDHDQSANRVGDDFSATVFGQLPPNAVLLTYWDALTNLSYAHCIDGQRPDLELRAYDPAARVTCDRADDPLGALATGRPVYALFAFDSELEPLRGSFDLVPGPTLALPYGGRGLDHSGVLYRLEPKAATP